MAPLAALERAELAARERRLAAGAEADRIVATASEQAGIIEAAAPERIAAALAERRRAHDERAAREIEPIERELARLESTPAVPERDPAFSAAVDLVVAAVLGEPVAAIAAAQGDAGAPVRSAHGER